MELLGQLAGGIAHDFNNSLTAIIGNLELALAKIDPSLPYAENLRDAHKSALRSAHLIRQLLGFARKQFTAPKAISLNQETESLIPMIRRLIRAQIDCVWHPCKDDPLLFIDPAQLDQILSNLCVNASDAIKEIGTITISCSTIHVEPEDCTQGHPCQSPSDYAVIRVSDNGNGIDKTALPHIFEPFFTTKPPGKGTGLGLSTVYGIVRQNKGYIDCQTEPGKGTAFTVFFPRHHDSTVKIESGSPEQTIQTHSETVLLVDEYSDESVPVILDYSVPVILLESVPPYRGGFGVVNYMNYFTFWRRSDLPLSSSRWALLRSRSRMLSATVGSAIMSCHWATGSCAVTMTACLP
jgi:hypothetical protein